MRVRFFVRIGDMVQIVEGKKIAEEITESLELKVSEIKSYGYDPVLAVVLVGENPASLSYIRLKKQKGDAVGIKVEVKNFSEHVSEEELLGEISKLNRDSQICGIIIQLPLPEHLDRQKILDAVSPELDIDCLTTNNKRKLIEGSDPFHMPPAPAAVLKILEYYKIGLADKHILIVGSGDLIGKPLSAILLNKKVPFELANRHTENLKDLAARADIIITGVGQKNLITADMVKDGAVVIDAATTGSDEGRITGDVDQESVSKKASLLAPVPGGVGPVTVAMLLENFIKSANRKLKISP